MNTAYLKPTGTGVFGLFYFLGHGGDDPGKVGINGALEKDINLEVALRVKSLLEQNDITVVMTREVDEGLYHSSDSNKKATDLKNRVALIANNKADVTVSIHQNSFPQEHVKGAQVFYYSASAEGKNFASLMQEQIKETINDGNHREAKGNDSYYMLKQTKCPIVIVECGFLSNSHEADLLTSKVYQSRMAWAIHLGILRYLNTDHF